SWWSNRPATRHPELPGRPPPRGRIWRQGSDATAEESLEPGGSEPGPPPPRRGSTKAHLLVFGLAELLSIAGVALRILGFQVVDAGHRLQGLLRADRV